MLVPSARRELQILPQIRTRNPAAVVEGSFYDARGRSVAVEKRGRKQRNAADDSGEEKDATVQTEVAADADNKEQKE